MNTGKVRNLPALGRKNEGRLIWDLKEKHLSFTPELQEMKTKESPVKREPVGGSQSLESFVQTLDFKIDPFSSVNGGVGIYKRLVRQFNSV